MSKQSLSKSPEQVRADVWRDVTHRLASAVGIMRAAERDFPKLSEDAREVIEEGVARLCALIADCARYQTLAEGEVKRS